MTVDNDILYFFNKHSLNYDSFSFEDLVIVYKESLFFAIENNFSDKSVESVINDVVLFSKILYLLEMDCDASIDELKRYNSDKFEFLLSIDNKDFEQVDFVYCFSHVICSNLRNSPYFKFYEPFLVSLFENVYSIDMVYTCCCDKEYVKEYCL